MFSLFPYNSLAGWRLYLGLQGTEMFSNLPTQLVNWRAWILALAQLIPKTICSSLCETATLLPVTLKSLSQSFWE